MIVTAEALGQYVSAVAKLPRFQELTATWRERARKEKAPVPATVRMSELAAQLFISVDAEAGGAGYETRYRTCCVMLMIHWRNRHVHTTSKAKLTHQEKQFIRACEGQICNDYAGLSVDRLFADFDSNRPTLKDATTLIAMTIQEVRAMDRALYICDGAPDVQAWLDHYKLTEHIEKIRRETAPEKQRSIHRQNAPH